MKQAAIRTGLWLILAAQGCTPFTPVPPPPGTLTHRTLDKTVPHHATYNYLIFGIVLVVMMIKRPEGLFPDASAKAEMHGVGIAAEVTGAGEAELAELAELEEVTLDDTPVPDPSVPPEPPPAAAGPEAQA